VAVEVAGERAELADSKHPVTNLETRGALPQLHDLTRVLKSRGELGLGGRGVETKDGEDLKRDRDRDREREREGFRKRFRGGVE